MKDDFTEEAVAEVELSAQDLLDMAPAVEVAAQAKPAIEAEAEARIGAEIEAEIGAEIEAVQRDTAAAIRSLETSQNIVAANVPPQRPRSAAPSLAMFRLSPPRMAWALGLTAATVLAIGANNREAAPRPIQPARVALPLPEVAPASEEVEQPPVLVTNPFDASEVFELPPGTGAEEARAMVAELLMERAIQRQVYVDSHSPTRR